MALRVVPLAQRGREQAEQPVGRAERRAVRAEDDAAPGIGLQQRVQPRRARRIAEPGADLGQVGDAGDADRVVGQARIVVGGQVVEHPARGLARAQLAVQDRQPGLPGPRHRLLLQEALEHRGHFSQPPLVAAQREHLHAEHAGGVGAVEAVAAAQRLQRQLFAVGEAALVGGDHRLRRQRGGFVEGLADGKAVLVVHARRGQRGRAVAGLHQVAGVPAHEGRMRPRQVRRAPRQFEAFARRLDAQRQRLGIPAAGDHRAQRVVQHLRVAQAARAGDGLAPGLLRLLRPAGEQQRPAQRTEHADALAAVGGFQQRQRFLQQSHRRRAVAALPPDGVARADGCGGKQAGIAQAPRQLGRVGEGRQRAGAVAGAVLCFAQAQQQAAALRVVAGLGGQGRGGEPVVAHRFFVRQHRRGPLRGLGCVFDGLAGIAGSVPMVGQRRQRRCRLAAERLPQGFGHAPVQRLAAGGRQLVVQRIAHQHVRELPLASVAALVDQAGRARLLQQLCARRCGRGLGQAGEQRDRELPADHRRLLQQLQAGRRQRIQARADDLAHALGQAPQRLARVGAGGVRRQQVAHHLGQEQRVAFAALVHQHTQAGRGQPGGGHEFGRLGGREAAEQQPLHLRVAVQLQQAVAQWMLARQFGVAVGAQQQQAAAAGFGHDEFQQPQRRHIGAVQVVQHQQQRLALGGALPEAGHRIEEPEAGLRRVGQRRLRRRLRQPGRELRVQRRQCGSAGAGEDARQPGFVLQRDPAAHQLHPRPVGRGAGLLGAAAPEREHLALRRDGDHLLRGARLADAGLAGQQHDAGLSGDGALQRLLQRLQLGVAADEAAFGGPVHRFRDRAGALRRRLRVALR